MENLTSKCFCEWDAALDILPRSIYNEAVAEKDYIKGQAEVHWCSWESPSFLPQVQKYCEAILIKHGVYSGKWTRSLKDLQALNYFKLQRPFGWSDFLHSKRWNLWKRAELISTTIVTEHMQRRWASAYSKREDVSNMYPGSSAAPKGIEKKLQQQYKAPYFHCKQFPSEEVSGLYSAGDEKPLRSAREKRWIQKKSLKFQLSYTQLPQTSQSICQSVPQQLLFLIKFFDSHKFPVYSLVWWFFSPSLSLFREIFPKLQLPRSKMFARFSLGWNTFPGL